MPKSVTEDISVFVDSTFEDKYSRIANQEYYFSYKVKIANRGLSDIQLLSRHWYIFDSNGEYAEVKGEGVIGQQPHIAPGETYEYESYCKLKTDVGLMWGSYLMKKNESSKLFEVRIPEFQLIVPFRLN
jgi:ApaG protein